jgi:hypothetical protein
MRFATRKVALPQNKKKSLLIYIFFYYGSVVCFCYYINIQISYSFSLLFFLFIFSIYFKLSNISVDLYVFMLFMIVMYIFYSLYKENSFIFPIYYKCIFGLRSTKHSSCATKEHCKSILSLMFSFLFEEQLKKKKRSLTKELFFGRLFLQK